MQKDWITGEDGRNLKFKREALLDYGGKVFFIYSVKAGGKKKQIYNTEVIDEIKEEIDRLKRLQS